MDARDFRPTPDVKFDRCLLRGKGRGIWVPISRAVRVEVNHSLLAIDGPLLPRASGGKSSPMGRSSLKLTHVTAFVGGPLVELQGAEKADKMGEMRTSGLVPMDTEMSSCLLAAVPGSGKPLVELNGIDATEIDDAIALGSPAWKSLCQLRHVGRGDDCPARGRSQPRPRSGTWTGGYRSRASPRGTRLGRHGLRRVRRVARPCLDQASGCGQGSSPTCSIPSAGDTGVDPKVLPEPWDDD